MSRPLSPSSKLRDRVDIYLTPSEKSVVRDKAITAGLSISAFIRKAALSQQIKAPPRFALEKWAELSRLGSNLNQISKAINSGQRPPLDTSILNELARAVSELRTQLLSETTPGEDR